MTPSHQVIVTQEIMRELANRQHQETHWGIEAVVEALKTQVLSVRMTGIVKSIVKKCELCLKNNPHSPQRPLLGVMKRGNNPGDYWQIDFSELLRQNGYQYLLVMINTLSGWPEAFPCCTNKAKEVAKYYLRK